MEPNDLPIVCLPLELLRRRPPNSSTSSTTSSRHSSAITSASCIGSPRSQNRNPGYSPFDRPDSDPPF